MDTGTNGKGTVAPFGQLTRADIQGMYQARRDAMKARADWLRASREADRFVPLVWAALGELVATIPTPPDFDSASYAEVMAEVMPGAMGREA
jgi:hypothetical protein